MNVNELEKLARWYNQHFGNFYTLYQNLISPIQNNSNQSSKLPLENELNSLISYLSKMDFDHLSLQQIRILDELGVGKYLGIAGAQFVEDTVRTSDYDPSTAYERLSLASSNLVETNSDFRNYIQSIERLNLASKIETADVDHVTIRVGFQKDAEINNLADWKDSAKDWYDIIRGIALAADEAPESTKVVGASTGSIILILAGTLSVTTLLALISGRLAGVARHVIGIANEIEDLRHKKFLNQVIEKELKNQQDAAKKAALDDILAIVAERLPNLDGEKQAALTASVKKLLVFNEKGGSLDFVAPDIDDEDAQETTEASQEAQGLAQIDLSAARRAIHEYQQVREQLKLLTSAYSTNSGAEV
ncbi:hypothetical protein [Rhizobium glycinendophyticum]|uniref:Uncharacterized protein n=1 Tax=Rhizobium glycinendophyticum TaxID=2589807 RepID=A0A504U656_9HYPH|nr:hypothetical protein [Rhizobium glycinendophyticum]TPP10508.1 hypothetical protein FJQ55_06580 [Rhizobium glycinendophyticum]